MTKTVIIIGIAMSAVLLTGVILSLVAPKRISITSKQFIKAPKELVFDQLRFMKKFPDWSPFRQQDPEQKFTVTGSDGELGATFNWEGVKEKSKGSQKVVALKANQRVDIQCNITEPFLANPLFVYTLHEKEEGTEVIQQFDVVMPVPGNIFGLLFGLKSKIASTNEQGLALLKQITEQQQLTLVSKK